MSPARAAPPVNGAEAEPFRVLMDARPPGAAAPSAAPAVRVRETPAPAGAGPRAPRREVEVAIDGYPGYTAWVWANYPRRLAVAIKEAADEAALAAILRQLVVAHNGWCDADGEPYPPADDPGFYEAIPLELGVLLVRAIELVPVAYPNSLSQTVGR